MSSTSAGTLTSLSSSTSASSYCSYIGTGNLSLSGWSSTQITTLYPYTATNPFISPNTNNTFSWSNLISRPTDKLPELIPRILAYRGEQDEIKDLSHIHSIYISICSCVTSPVTSTEKTVEKYKNLWEISKCNETIWLMLSKNEDKDVSQIAEFLLLHCH